MSEERYVCLVGSIGLELGCGLFAAVVTCLTSRGAQMDAKDLLTNLGPLSVSR